MSYRVLYASRAAFPYGLRRAIPEPETFSARVDILPEPLWATYRQEHHVWHEIIVERRPTSTLTASVCGPFEDGVIYTDAVQNSEQVILALAAMSLRRLNTGG